MKKISLLDKVYSQETSHCVILCGLIWAWFAAFHINLTLGGFTILVFLSIFILCGLTYSYDLVLKTRKINKLTESK